MELHLNARLMMNELIKINFIIMNTKGSNDDWLLVLESGLINIHASGAFLDWPEHRGPRSSTDSSTRRVGEASAAAPGSGINFLARPPVPAGGAQLMNC